ncbi:MAG: nuclear transport factor 2 family protein [Actinomycetota bacterium]
MDTNEALIERFYRAFGEADHTTMAACYSDRATFKDPVFPQLDAEGVRGMWRMFCTSGNKIEVSHSDVKADATTGSARWEAVYAFPKTKRRVHNVISASFRFEDGLILRHEDSFDFYRWSRMALGAPGVLLGWSPVVKNQVRKQAAAQLRRFRAQEN